MELHQLSRCALHLSRCSAFPVSSPGLDDGDADNRRSGGDPQRHRVDTLIGSFDVHDPEESDEPTVRYRLCHQYLYIGSPESHVFLLLTGTSEFTVTNLFFGHSYELPTESELWEFENWMTKEMRRIPWGKNPCRSPSTGRDSFPIQRAGPCN